MIVMMISWSIEVVLDVIIVAWARLKNVVLVANHFIIAGEFQSVLVTRTNML